MKKRKTTNWREIAIRRRDTLEEMIDLLCECGDFSLEHGANGEGAIVRACRLIRKPLPAALKEWFREGDA